jgi:tol-pal system protein YbgF
MIKRLIAVVFCLTVSVVEAQVRVVESSPQNVRTGARAQQESVAQKTETYNQIKSLQQEVSELRALVEEQGHQLSRLKQLQLDNYVDLDRRVAILSGGGQTAPTTDAAQPAPDAPIDAVSSSSAAPLEAAPVVPESLSEADEYKAAYELLRQREIDPSILAFKEYLKKYPSGSFAANSCYWLGEIYLLKNQLPQARDWFTKLLEGFADSNKVPDAKFKLGKVYHLMGDKKRAKILLDEAAAGSGDSARIAKQYLQDNFQ